MSLACLIPTFLLYLYMMTPLASFNTQGLCSQDHCKSAFNFLLSNHLDIILLQETLWTVDMEMQTNHEWNGNIFYSYSSNTARGVAILVHSRLNAHIIETKGDNEGCIINIMIDFDDHTISTINIYAPSTDTGRQIFFSIIDKFIKNRHENKLSGDFNCIANARLDTLGGDLNRCRLVASTLETICYQHNLPDIWCKQNKDKRCFTWTGRHPSDDSYISTCINKFYITRSLNLFIADVFIKLYPFSDHYYMLLSLFFDEIKQGPGYWHFNNDLLSDANFLTEIQEFWNEWSEKIDDFANPLIWGNKTIQYFKRIAIRRAKLRNKQQRHKRTQLEQKLEKLKEKLVSGNLCDIENYLLAKETLKQLREKETEGIKLQAKAQYTEEGERSTKYFSLQKNRQADQTITHLTKDNLDTTSDTKCLLAETQSFYRKLFAEEPYDKPAQDQFLGDYSQTNR